MKMLIAATLLVATAASAKDYVFQAKAVCGFFSGSFDNQVAPDEHLFLHAVCKPLKVVKGKMGYACGLKISGEAGPNRWVGYEVKGGVEAYKTTDSDGVFQLLGCDAKGRCSIFKMFNVSEMEGVSCADPARQ